MMKNSEIQMNPNELVQFLKKPAGTSVRFRIFATGTEESSGGKTSMDL